MVPEKERGRERSETATQGKGKEVVEWRSEDGERLRDQRKRRRWFLSSLVFLFRCLAVFLTPPIEALGEEVVVVGIYKAIVVEVGVGPGRREGFAEGIEIVGVH